MLEPSRTHPEWAREEMALRQREAPAPPHQAAECQAEAAAPRLADREDAHPRWAEAAAARWPQ